MLVILAIRRRGDLGMIAMIEIEGRGFGTMLNAFSILRYLEWTPSSRKAGRTGGRYRCALRDEKIQSI
jgi:hypothetical protein